MIIARIIGGIGNQMFQYAFGRRLADSLGAELKLDISGYAAYKDRSYQLPQLRVDCPIADADECAALAGRQVTRYRRLMRRHLPALARAPETYFLEKSVTFDPGMLDVPDGSYVDGYWHSERYFAPIAERIRNEYVPRERLSPSAQEMGEEMQSCESVSLHVRRGDYVHNPIAFNHHYVCDQDYYRRCVDHIRSVIDSPRVFIFSDEPDWVKANMPLPVPTVVVSPGAQTQEATELWLMSSCRSHIIANSSFSWWGAWLDPRPDKLVLMPKQWFRRNGSVYSQRCASFRPDGWLPV